MGLGGFLGVAVGLAEIPLLLDGETGVAVVGRVAEDHEDLLLLLHVVGGVALLGELGKWEIFGRFYRHPAGEGIGEEDSGALVLFVIERSTPAGEEKIDLEVGDDIGRGKEFEAVESFLGHLANLERGLGFAAALDEAAVDEAQRLDEEGPGAAAGVEDDDAGIGETVGQSKIFPERLVHAADHVTDDLGRGIPDAEVFAQLGIELGEEGLVEILHGLAHVVAGEEAGAVHAGEAFLRPIKDFFEIQGADFFRIPGKLDEERAQDRQAEVLGGEPPLETVAGFGVGFVPEHPGGEDAVEERLDEGGLEKVDPFVALEPDAERVAEGNFHGLERAHGSDLDAGAGFAGVTGEKCGEVLRDRDAGGAQQGASEELPEAFVLGVLRVLPQGVGFVPEGLLAAGDDVAFAGNGFACDPGEEGEAAVVCDENLAVMLEVASHLRGLLQPGDVLREALHLDHPALGFHLQQSGRVLAVPAEFLGGEEPAIGQAGPGIGGMQDGGDLRLESVADGVEEVSQRGITRGFRNTDAERLVQVGQVFGDRVRHRPAY